MAQYFSRHSKPLFALVLVLVTSRYALAGREYLAGPRDHVAPDQLLVRLQPGADINQILNPIAQRAAAILLSRELNTYLLKLPPGISATASRLLAAHPLVTYVEPNRIRNFAVNLPNDPYLPSKQWNLTAIQAQQAWTYFPNAFLTAATASANRVKVAILDTGIDCTHPDFMNAGGTSTDSAQGGQILWSSSSALQPTTVPSHVCNWQDDNGHGTHVAGIVAAATNNGTGIASLGFPLQIIVIKTSDSQGNASDYQVSAGINAAVNQGAQVISMSLGGAGYSQTLQTAMDFAWAHNVVVVAAAGNGGNNQLIYPGDGNHVLAVAATDGNNAAANFSSYGEWVRIAAPGVGIYSTLPSYGSSKGTNYGTLDGTSMATPHVAALAGLLFAANPGISAEAVAQRIMQTAQSPTAAWDQHLGYGVINAGAALGNIPGVFTQGALTGQVTDSSGNALNASAVVTVTGGASFTTDGTGLFRINLNPGTYTITVTASGYSTVTLQGAVVAGADTMLSIPMGTSPLPGTFTGTVSHNGVAVPGAVVEANFGGLVAGTAVADSAGSYTLSVPPTTYTLTASAPNYLSTTSGSQTVSANATVTVNLALSALGNVAGTVTDLNGIPVPNAEIDFTSGSFTGGAFTGAAGTYSTYGLPAGTYTVTASASGYTSVSIGSVSVTANTSTLVNFHFSTGVALGNGLVGYWPLNEGSGSVAHDQSGNGHDAALIGASWAPGLSSQYAVNFSGTSYGLTQAISFSAPLSVSVWVNPGTNGSNVTLLQSSGWFLGVDQNNAHYKFFVNAGSGTTGTCAVSYIARGCAQGGPIATGWHMVTGTFDGTTAILYVDGVNVGSDTMTGVSGSWPMYFGNNWTGAMQSARVYNRALTASEVSSLFSQAANLSLTKTADAATVAAGASIGFTMSASNNGTGAATSATLTDPLPAGTGVNWSISPAYSGPGTCSIAGGSLTCNFGNLPSGGSASVHVTSATSNASCGPYANTATLSASNAGAVHASATTAVTCGQSINFTALPNQVYGTTPFPVSASATSGLAVSFNSNATPSICSVSGSTVTLLMGGTCTITSTQGGNTYYSAATPVSQSFTVTPATQSISFAAPANQTYGTAPFPVSASATSGLAVSINANATPAVCSTSGSTVTLLATGTCTIQATQAGNVDYAAATAVSQSFSVTPASQTITFPAISNQPLGSAPFPVTATASSGLTVSFGSQTAAVCTMSGATVTLIAVGACIIQATQAGNPNYAAAPSVTRTFTVTAGNATTILASSGSGQSTLVGTSFTAVLQSLVKDSGGNPVANLSVTFTAPSSGAGGTFSNGSTTYTTTTNSSGIAASLAFTANAVAGSYSVTSAATGVTGAAGFSLTNVALPSLTIAESNTTFVQGRSTTYSVTVSNAANAGPTSAPVTVTVSVPAGLTLTALNGGSAWTCSLQTASCTTNGVLAAGSSSQVSVTMSVASNAQGPVSIGASLSSGASQRTVATYSTPILSACSVTQDTSTSVTDVQMIVNEALGASLPDHDLNGDGLINVVDLQIVLNAALQKGCSTL